MLECCTSANGLEGGTYSTTVQGEMRPTGLLEQLKYKLAVDGGKMCAKFLIDHLVEITEREQMRSSVVLGRKYVVQIRPLLEDN